MPAKSHDGKVELWRRAYEIFDFVLEYPAQEREPLAREQAASDADLLEIVLELIGSASEENPDGAAESGVLRPGHRIGRYEITGPVGRGGMGHVYAARDTELGRVVALKLLAAGGTSDQLIREARAASALNHPNIVSVHDIVPMGSEIAIAMELVEGASLRAYCGQAQPLGTVMGWGRQIAQALSATHARGIVHRDIKPENVMVRPDGYVKVLDFGLARQDRLAGAASTQSSLFGKLGGTLNYMSPEQTRGETPKAPSDIFSLGVVLSELACGHHPFPAASPIETAYAIAHHRPKRHTELPRAFSDLLDAMMAPKPEDRPAAIQVEQHLTTALADEQAREAPAVTRTANPWKSIGVAAAVLAGLAVGARFWLANQSGRPPVRFSIPIDAAEKVAPTFAISPQGDQIAYQDDQRLYRVDLSGPGKYGEPRAIPGSEGAVAPFFSPDGKEVGYFLKDRIRAAARSGYREIGATPPVARIHGAWGGNRYIYFDADGNGSSGIWRIPDAGGGKPELVIGSESTARGFGFRMAQQWLPGGLIFSVAFGPSARSVDWLDESTRETHRLVERGMGGEVTASGHLLYYWMGSLFAAPFDARRHRISGPAAEVVKDVEAAGWIGGGAAVSETGTLAYLKSGKPSSRQLVWVTPEGRETALPLAPDAFEQADVSPDGNRVAIVRVNAQRRWVLLVYDVKSNTSATLFESPLEKLRAIWSPDSKSLVVSRTLEGRDFANLFLVPVNAPELAKRLTDQPDFGNYPMSWSGPAQSILFLEGIHPKSESDIMMVSLATGTVKSMVASRGADRSPTFSPDGRWFAYSVDVERAVFLQDVAQTQPPRKIAGTDGGWNPLWSPKGDRIYYLNPADGLMEVPVDASGVTGVPKQLVDHGFTAHNLDYWTRNYSIAGDGRFLVMRDVPQPVRPRQEIQVIVNWFSELNRLAPRR